MKKFVAILCVLVMSLSLFTACGKKKAVKAAIERYEASNPTGMVANTTQRFGEQELLGTYTLTTGSVDGKAAAVYTEEYERMRTTDEGSGQTVVPTKEEVSTIKEYIEGRGVRTDRKGKWDKEATIDIPTKGAIALNLVKKHLEEISYSDHTLSFYVKAENTAEVLGIAVEADVRVSIIDDGALVTGVNIFWLIPGNEAEQTVDTSTEINVTYTYGYQPINIA